MFMFGNRYLHTTLPCTDRNKILNNGMKKFNQKSNQSSSQKQKLIALVSGVVKRMTHIALRNSGNFGLTT